MKIFSGLVGSNDSCVEGEEGRSAGGEWREQTNVIVKRSGGQAKRNPRGSRMRSSWVSGWIVAPTIWPSTGGLSS